MKQTIDYDSDIFDGITLKAHSLPNSVQELCQVLDHLLEQFKAQKKRIVWVTLSIQQAHFIQTFTDRQFHFHNCHDDNLTLTRCLQGISEIPFKPTHTIGAGAVVTSGNKILVVKERLMSSKGFKLPGGHMELGESIAATAIREVWEETGIRARFVSVNGLVNKFPYRFDKANIYFVCRLAALTQDIHIHQPEEIQEAKWIDIQEYLEDPDNAEFNRQAAQAGFYKDGMTLKELNSRLNTTDKREVLFSKL